MGGRVALVGGRSATANNEHVAQFTDRFGDVREVHRTRQGLRVKEVVATPILKLNRSIGLLIGARIKAARLNAGLSQRELAEAMGMRSGHPKQRIHEIESSTRQEGIRLGTLYAAALALGVEPCVLLPSVEEVTELCGVELVSVPEVRVK